MSENQFSDDEFSPNVDGEEPEADIADGESSDDGFTPNGYRNDPEYAEGEIPETVDDSTEILAEYRKRLQNLSYWCNCKGCHIMPTGKECRCCNEMSSLQEKIDNLTSTSLPAFAPTSHPTSTYPSPSPSSCIITHPEFSKVCLEKIHLELA